MSFRRIQSRAINHNVYLENRLTTFLSPPVHTGDLIVERDELVNGNLTVKKDLHANSFYATGNYFLDNYILIPAGTIIQSAAKNAPSGWLDCDGRLLNKIAFSDLFDMIENQFGGLVSDLSFNIPDMRGRVGVGMGWGPDLTTRAIAETGGAETHALTTGEMPVHSHGVSDPGHAHSQTTINDDFNNTGSNPPGFAADGAGERIWTNINSATTGISVNNAGSGNAHNNMQPFLVIRYLIKY